MLAQESTPEPTPLPTLTAIPSPTPSPTLTETPPPTWTPDSNHLASVSGTSIRIVPVNCNSTCTPTVIATNAVGGTLDWGASAACPPADGNTPADNACQIRTPICNGTFAEINIRGNTPSNQPMSSNNGNPLPEVIFPFFSGQLNIYGAYRDPFAPFQWPNAEVLNNWIYVGYTNSSGGQSYGWIQDFQLVGTTCPAISQLPILDGFGAIINLTPPTLTPTITFTPSPTPLVSNTPRPTYPPPTPGIRTPGPTIQTQLCVDEAQWIRDLCRQGWGYLDDTEAQQIQAAINAGLDITSYQSVDTWWLQNLARGITDVCQVPNF